MRSMIKAWIGLAVLTAAIDAARGSARSLQYPTQVVRIVVPVSPGSIADGFARMIAEKLADMWKQQVIVENRPGLAGTTSVAKSPPDGYTLFLNSNGHTIAGAINKNLQFDPVKDFAGITLIASVPLVMIVPPASPAKTVKDFVALAREKPGQLNVANAGVSTTSFLSAEVFKQSARIDVVHVPYRGAPEAVTAVVRGDAHMYFAPIPSAQELAALRAKSSSSPSILRPAYRKCLTCRRSPRPVLRTSSTSPGSACLAPAGTPRPILQKVSQDIAKVLGQVDLRDRMQSKARYPSPTRRNNSTPSSGTTPRATPGFCAMLELARSDEGHRIMAHV